MAADDATGQVEGAADQAQSPPDVPATTKRTRASGAYLAVGVSLLVLILVLDFIIQNLRNATIHFLNLSFRLPIGLTILAGAIGGGLIVLLVSSLRVLQLRRSTRRQHKAAVAASSR